MLIIQAERQTRQSVQARRFTLRRGPGRPHIWSTRDANPPPVSASLRSAASLAAEVEGRPAVGGEADPQRRGTGASCHLQHTRRPGPCNRPAAGDPSTAIFIVAKVDRTDRWLPSIALAELPCLTLPACHAPRRRVRADPDLDALHPRSAGHSPTPWRLPGTAISRTRNRVGCGRSYQSPPCHFGK